MNPAPRGGRGRRRIPAANDFYVRNINPTNRTLTVGADAAATWMSNPADPITEVTGSYTDWLGARTGRGFQPDAWLTIVDEPLIAYHRPVAAPGSRVLQERSEGEVGRVVAFPQSIRSPEVGDSRFGGDPGPGEYQDPPGFAQDLDGLRQSLSRGVVLGFGGHGEVVERVIGVVQ